VVIFRREGHEEHEEHEGAKTNAFVSFVIFVAEDRYHHVGGAVRSVFSSS
jgi:hypothetical protein